MNNKDQINITLNLELSEQGKRLLDALRPKGEWVDKRHNTAICSICHKVSMHEQWGDKLKYYDFCPNCGADMRGRYE